MRNDLMFTAINRLKIVSAHEEACKELWNERETHLNGVEGFQSLNLLKGQPAEHYTLHASYTAEPSKDCFEKWTKYSSFRLAHKSSSENSNLHFAHPILRNPT